MGLLALLVYAVLTLVWHVRSEQWTALGSEHEPFEKVAEVNGITSSDFHRLFVVKNSPLVVRNALLGTKPLALWDDHYLKRVHGDVEVNVDPTKYEDRSKSSISLSLADFLDNYRDKEYYLIDTLPDSLQREFPVPDVMRCDGFLNRFQDFVWWFSSGGSMSTLHFDNVENLYCQISGKKRWIFVDPANGSVHIPLDHPEGHYCGVNVSAVDFNLYPTLKEMPYRFAELNEGDCLYVPLNWWHQVRSSPTRNMAVNIWWAPSLNTELGADDVSCQGTNSSELNLSDLSFTYGEWIRYSLGQLAGQNGDKLDFGTMRERVVHEHTGEKLVTRRSFDLLDSDQDGFVEVGELRRHTAETIHAAVQHVPIGAMNINGKGGPPNVWDKENTEESCEANGKCK